MAIQIITPNVLIPSELDAVVGLKRRVRLQKHLTINGDSFQAQRNAAWMEVERRNLQAYEYLCHIGEAKQWIEACIEEEIAPIDKIEESLRDGVIIAKLARTFEPTCVKKIFENPKIQYRHSDNINFFLAAIRKIALPENFHFELTDLYENKNLPKVIYCIHALGHLLFQQGRGPSVNNLIGKLNFSEEQLQAAQRGLERTGVPMPSFKHIEVTLSQELLKLEFHHKIEKESYWKTKEFLVQKCQAIIRGYLGRRLYKEYRAIYRKNTVKIQSWACGVITRNPLHNNESKCVGNNQIDVKNIIQMQASFCTYLKRDKHCYEKGEHLVVKELVTAHGNSAGHQVKQNRSSYKQNQDNNVYGQVVTLNRYYMEEDRIIQAQALIRGYLTHNNVIELFRIQEFAFQQNPNLPLLESNTTIYRNLQGKLKYPLNHEAIVTDCYFFIEGTIPQVIEEYITKNLTQLEYYNIQGKDIYFQLSNNDSVKYLICAEDATRRQNYYIQPLVLLKECRRQSGCSQQRYINLIHLKLSVKQNPRSDPTKQIVYITALTLFSQNELVHRHVYLFKAAIRTRISNATKSQEFLRAKSVPTIYYNGANSVSTISKCFRKEEPSTSCRNGTLYVIIASDHPDTLDISATYSMLTHSVDGTNLSLNRMRHITYQDENITIQELLREQKDNLSHVVYHCYECPTSTFPSNSAITMPNQVNYHKLKNSGILSTYVLKGDNIDSLAEFKNTSRAIVKYLNCMPSSESKVCDQKLTLIQSTNLVEGKKETKNIQLERTISEDCEMMIANKPSAKFNDLDVK
ncbi:iqgap- protein [Basidiobolus ranarum]|uniref:Iqgap- protein n=1 Tax=Basidiobolus ranarum TaxID=34480 RepID=A0ABR2WAJ1_9FUNG